MSKQTDKANWLDAILLKFFYKALSKMCMICAMQVNLERALLLKKKHFSLENKPLAWAGITLPL